MDPINETKNALLERLSSPITGVYVITWLVYNWKIPAILFLNSDIPVSTRISEIQNLNINWCDKILVFIVPLALTAAYLLVMPFVRHLYLKLVVLPEMKKRQLAEDDAQRELKFAKEFGTAYDRIYEAVLYRYVSTRQSFLNISQLVNSISRKGYSGDSLQTVVLEVANTCDEKAKEVHEITVLLGTGKENRGLVKQIEDYVKSKGLKQQR